MPVNFRKLREKSGNITVFPGKCGKIRPNGKKEAKIYNIAKGTTI
jgi:hypothetical protein